MIVFPHLFYRLLWSPARKQVHFAQLLLARCLFVLLYIVTPTLNWLQECIGCTGMYRIYDFINITYITQVPNVAH